MLDLLSRYFLGDHLRTLQLLPINGKNLKKINQRQYSFVKHYN